MIELSLLNLHWSLVFVSSDQSFIIFLVRDDVHERSRAGLSFSYLSVCYRCARIMVFMLLLWYLRLDSKLISFTLTVEKLNHLKRQYPPPRQ